MSEKNEPRNFDYFLEKKYKQVRNRYSSAGITAREGATLEKSMAKIRKIASKNNLFVGYKKPLLNAADLIEEVLRQADRLE